MRNCLLGGTAIAIIGAMSQPVLAAEPIKLTVGGFFREAYMAVIDDDDDLFDLGFDRNTDGFFNDAEVHFTGSTVLDNGLEIGARVELEGESEQDGEGIGDQIDEAWIWFSGDFGEVRIGSEDEALANACVVPPGGTTNFSAFSPNQWGANTQNFYQFAPSHSVCTGVDIRSDAQKLVYISPVFAGFQLTASYTPDPFAETHAQGAGPHVGMPSSFDGLPDQDLSAYVTYVYEGETWGLTAGFGGSWEVHIDNPPDQRVNEKDFYQAGLNLTFGNFSIGAVGEYYNDLVNIHQDDGRFRERDVWVAGLGVAYQVDAWRFGAQYSHRHDDQDEDDPDGTFHLDGDRIVGTINYALGPGIEIDTELGYTWTDSDPERRPIFDDDYDAIEFGIGTAITF